jgi:hypothetical protein
MIPPSPSANHQTASDRAIEEARATLTVGRRAIPMASSSWEEHRLGLQDGVEHPDPGQCYLENPAKVRCPSFRS